MIAHKGISSEVLGPRRNRGGVGDGIGQVGIRRKCGRRAGVTDRTACWIVNIVFQGKGRWVYGCRIHRLAEGDANGNVYRNISCPIGWSG